LHFEVFRSHHNFQIKMPPEIAKKKFQTQKSRTNVVPAEIERKIKHADELQVRWQVHADVYF